jgi:hypothetical protein
MRRTALILGAACVALFSTSATAQLAVAAKAGTTGLGGEVSFGLGSRFALRGGVGVIPSKPEFELSDIKYEVDPPTPMFTVGADLYITGGLRVFGGLLIGADKLDITHDYNQTVTFGGQTYTGSGTITGTIETSSTAPFVGLGLGRTIGSGIGLFLDLGAAILGESEVTVDATGPVRNAPDYNTRRQAEEDKIQDQVDKYVKVYPMISIGLRIGLGG